jgi:hypothetical protein
MSSFQDKYEGSCGEGPRFPGSALANGQPRGPAMDWSCAGCKKALHRVVKKAGSNRANQPVPDLSRKDELHDLT